MLLVSPHFTSPSPPFRPRTSRFPPVGLPSIVQRDSYWHVMIFISVMSFRASAYLSIRSPQKCCFAVLSRKFISLLFTLQLLHKGLCSMALLFLRYGPMGGYNNMNYWLASWVRTESFPGIWGAFFPYFSAACGMVGFGSYVESAVVATVA